MSVLRTFVSGERTRHPGTSPGHSTRTGGDGRRGQMPIPACSPSAAAPVGPRSGHRAPPSDLPPRQERAPSSRHRSLPHALRVRLRPPRRERLLLLRGQPLQLCGLPARLLRSLVLWRAWLPRPRARPCGQPPEPHARLQWPSGQPAVRGLPDHLPAAWRRTSPAWSSWHPRTCLAAFRNDLCDFAWWYCMDRRGLCPALRVDQRAARPGLRQRHARAGPCQSERRTIEGSLDFWRREWDSNPRYACTYTRFPSVRLKPLGHLSSAGGGGHSRPRAPGKPRFQASIFKAARKADCGISTLPNWRIRFLPSFCFSNSFRLREMSPP